MLALLLVCLMFGGLFAAVYAILAVTYFHIATMKTGERRAKYKEKTQVARAPIAALLRREILHIIKSPMYLLNAGMGSLMMVMVAVMMAVTGDLLG
jgi:hypothetical protein